MRFELKELQETSPVRLKNAAEGRVLLVVGQQLSLGARNDFLALSEPAFYTFR